MSVLNRAQVADILYSAGVDPNEGVLDKVMDFQRILQVRFQGRRCPPHHVAVIMELACRQMNHTCSREKILSNLGLKTPSHEYRKEMVTCEAGLGLKPTGQNLIAALSMKYGHEYIQKAQNETHSVIQHYISALPTQQQNMVDSHDPIFLGAVLHLVSQKYEAVISLDDISSIVDCSKQQLNKMCNIIQKRQNPQLKSNKIMYSPCGGDTLSVPETFSSNPKESRLRISRKSTLQYAAAIAPLDAAKPKSISKDNTVTEALANSSNSINQDLASNQQNDPTIGIKANNHRNKREAYEAWKAEQLCKKR